MVLKLHGAPYSPCTRRVAIVLHEKKIPFDLILVDMQKREHKSASVLAYQPFGQVPYIDDDGFILYESRAICRYLEDKYPEQGTKLVPSDAQSKALFEQAASIEFSNFEPFASGAVMEIILKPIFLGQPSDEPAFEKLIAGLSTKLDAYEVILGKQKYLAGNEITLVDLWHLPYATMLEEAGSDIMTTKGPNVTRYFNDLTMRPSWVAVKDNIQSVARY
ncbi:thioredoxin-like protein [Mycena capillaripes]|nr:thioredoxin-like protein [Mycena capillaripes]